MTAKEYFRQLQDMKKLTPKQERFVDEYLADLNAAAKRVRYKNLNIGR